MPLNITDESSGENVLFPYGYGLSYTSNGTGFKEKKKKITSLEVFPNPAENEVSLEWKQSGNGYITLSDMTGQTVIRKPFWNKRKLNVSLNDVKAGMYVINLYVPGKRTTQSLLNVVR